MPPRIRHSSTRRPTATVNEAGRHLDRLRRQGPCGQPRPVVIVQDDAFDATDTITVCAFTTDPTEATLFRLPVEPNGRNGLRSPSRLMVDRIATVAKSKVRARIGRLDDEDVVRLNQAVLVFLGLAVSPRAGRRGVS